MDRDEETLRAQARRVVDLWEERWRSPMVDPAFARLFAVWRGAAQSEEAAADPFRPTGRGEE